MSFISVLTLLSVMSQTFAQNFFQAPLRDDSVQRGPFGDDPYRAGTGNSEGHLEETDLSSPVLSLFAEYNLKVLEEEGIYPRLFDISFSPDKVGEIFYNEAIYFALQNGLYEVGNLPQQIADAVVQVFPYLTTLEYFKVISNTLEHLLESGGIATEGNYQVLVRLNAKILAEAMKSIKVNDARSALHAILVGAGRMLELFSLNSPDNVRNAMELLVEHFDQVPLKKNPQ